MSELFDHLSQLFEDGHARAVDGLLSDRDLAGAGAQTPAAVLIAVTNRARPGVLLTQRPNDMRDHPGQVALPGGKVDPGEDAIAAAVREAEEELALPRDQVRVIGPSDCYRTGTGFDITPILAVVPPDLPLVASPGEVEAWFEAPLETLLNRGNWEKHRVFWQGKQRTYYELMYDGFRIWGVTAAILLNLAKRIRLEDVESLRRSA